MSLPLAAPRVDAARLPPSRMPVILASLVFALVVGVLAWRGAARLNVPGAPDAQHWALNDFRDAVYYPVVAFLDGINPYDRRAYRAAYPIGTEFPLYAPHTLLVHLPFGLLPYEAARVVYAAIVVALTVVLAALALEAGGAARTGARVLGLAALLLLSRPGHNNLMLGQVTAQVVIASWVAIRWAATRPALASVALAVSLLKPTFGVPIAFLLWCRGDRRAALGGAALAGVAGLAVVARLVVAAGGVGPFVASLTDNLGGFDGAPLVNPATSPFRIDTAALVARVLDWHSRAAELPMTVAVLALAGLVLAALRRGGRAVRGPVATALVCTATLACIYHQAYDLLLLVPPAMALVAARVSADGWTRVLLALLVLPMANYLATDTSLRRLDLEGTAWVVVTSLNGVAVTAAFLLCLALAWRRVPA
jgi:hypothetical protein